MVTILLHSSKTTRHPTAAAMNKGQRPLLHEDASILAKYLKSLSVSQIQATMKVSEIMAARIHDLLKGWSDTAPTLPAIDLFLGDIYSGLQVQSFTAENRSYANEHLFILSGLYGVLRALDEIQPYRLEMGYKLPGNMHDAVQKDITSLYDFWGDKIAKQLPAGQTIINLSAVEYTKAVFKYVKNAQIISPKFLTVSPKTREPTFVTVHAKVARGAFARWLIQHQIDTVHDLKNFNELGYEFSPELSTKDEPVFVAQEFKGIGLSVRLT